MECGLSITLPSTSCDEVEAPRLVFQGEQDALNWDADGVRDLLHDGEREIMVLRVAGGVDPDQRLAVWVHLLCDFLCPRVDRLQHVVGVVSEETLGLHDCNALAQSMPSRVIR